MQTFSLSRAFFFHKILRFAYSAYQTRPFLTPVHSYYDAPEISKQKDKSREVYTLRLDGNSIRSGNLIAYSSFFTWS